MNTEVVERSREIISVKRYAFLFFKRCFDMVASLFGILFLIPIMAIVKICNMISGDYDSIWLKQERIGKNGKIFNLYKFRSMCMHADEKLEEILKNDKAMAKEYKKYKKLENDPRITRVGKILRKTSLDEMPQFINVFKNDMSMIGNRPYLPREKADMEEFYDDIVTTKPGITGYWQTNGRSDVAFVDRLKLERYYSLNQTFILDIKIFFLTIFLVFKSKGAK